MEEFIIYCDYQRALIMLEDNRVNSFRRAYDADDLAGFKALFPIDEPLQKEHEELPF